MSCKVEMRGVSFRYGENTILDSVDLTVPPGGVVVFGGVGKSALLEICAGLLKPLAGTVTWDGEDITNMPKYDLYDRRRSVGYVFQNNALIANHSVFDNIALPLKCGTDLSGEQIRKRVLALMEEFGISREIEKKFPETLSVTQLKSVAIARALINEPKLLLMDEPVSALDPSTANAIVSVLHGKWRKSGMSIIMAAHSMSVWPEWGTGRFMLKEGRLKPADEALAKVYDAKFHQRYGHAK